MINHLLLTDQACPSQDVKIEFVPANNQVFLKIGLKYESCINHSVRYWMFLCAPHKKFFVDLITLNY